MKIGIFTDVHWSTTTSILRSREGDYSTRINLLIKGMNWANDLFAQKDCVAAVCAGDFFDKSSCVDEELSSVKEIHWRVPTCFLVGNHESSRADLSASTTSALKHLFNAYPFAVLDSNVFNTVTLVNHDNVQFYFIPYVTESDRKPLKEYLKDYDPNKKHVIFSHNDLRNVRYGPFLNTTGFSIEEIEEVADLYLNGHIHNGQWITSKILDLGSMTAQNFTNDSNSYRYGVWILDTDTLELQFYENPYSLNFYKFDFETPEEINDLYGIKANAILSIKCLEPLKEDLLEALGSNSCKILVVRVNYYNLIEDTNEEVECAPVKSDHLEQFRQYILENVGDTDVIREELNEICK